MSKSSLFDVPKPRPAWMDYIGDTLSVREAAALLGCSKKTVHRLIWAGALVAWTPNPQGVKLRLWRKQVSQLAASQQADAIRRAQVLSCQMEFDF